MQWKHLLYMFASVFLPELEHIVWLMQKSMNAAWEGVNSGQISPLQEHYLVRGQWETVWHEIVITNHFLIHKDTSHNVCCSRDTVFVKLFNSKIKMISVSLQCEQEIPRPFFYASLLLAGKPEEGPYHGLFWKKKKNVPPSPALVHFVSPDSLSFCATNRVILGLTTTHTCLNNQPRHRSWDASKTAGREST